jgi:hypothetical protein
LALTHQGQEGAQSGSVACTGIELDSGPKQSRLIEALKALSLAFKALSLVFSALSCSVSLSICSLSLCTRKISFSTCKISFSIRILSILKACMRVS